MTGKLHARYLLMNQLFLCYRRAGAQTAKLLSFYIKRTHPEINVWYSDLEKEGNFSLDIPELLRESYGAVVFVTEGFTRKFLNKDGKINAVRYGEFQPEECITVQEIIEIEKCIQTRDDFELHIVNLDGAVLNKRDQLTIKSVFEQAGILTPESVAHFAQRNINAFYVASDNEEAFFHRMIGSYLPNNTQIPVQGNYNVGNYVTTVDVLCWDCDNYILPENISFELNQEDIPFYQKLEIAPCREEVLKQDDDILSVVRFEQGLTTNEENKYIRMSCKISKYHLFKKALDLWNKNGFRMNAEIMAYLNGEEENRIYTIPNAMGLALMVITADEKLVFSRRSSKRRVRSNEFDCSIVEGLLPVVDKKMGGVHTTYDYTSADYISLECKRAFYEEICIDPKLSTSIFGLIFDRMYGQWNFAGMIRSSLTSDELQRLHPVRDDTTESNRLFFIDYKNKDGKKDIKAIKDALELFRKDGFWDTALTVMTGTLTTLGFSQTEINNLYQ